MKLAVLNVAILCAMSVSSHGAVTFRDPVRDFPTGKAPAFVATADLNGDGIDDLVVANQASNTLTILLSDGKGGFHQKASPVTPVGPVQVAVADLNHDGKMDLVVACAASNQVSVYLGKGDGTFAPEKDYFSGMQPSYVAIADFNGDGKLDLAVANQGDNTVSIMSGNGDGTFRAPRAFSAGGTGPHYLAVADFSGDRKRDIAIASQTGVTLIVGNGAGVFGAPTTVLSGGNASVVAASDLNRDGKQDLVVIVDPFTQCQVLLGNGDGTFVPLTGFGFSYSGVAIADFNGDGIPDLALSGFSTSVSVLAGVGDGTFRSAGFYATGANPVSVAVGGFNGDHKADFATANMSSNSVSVSFGNGDGTFRQPPAVGLVGGGSLVQGDLNRDGIPDLVLGDSFFVQIAFGDGKGSFGPQQGIFLGFKIGRAHV